MNLVISYIKFRRQVMKIKSNKIFVTEYKMFESIEIEVLINQR